jgi:hypothetical protein
VHMLARLLTLADPKEVIGESYTKSLEMLNRFKTVRLAGLYDGKTLHLTTCVRDIN